jgi:hypothetical protein
MLCCIKYSLYDIISPVVEVNFTKLYNNCKEYCKTIVLLTNKFFKKYTYVHVYFKIMCAVHPLSSRVVYKFYFANNPLVPLPPMPHGLRCRVVLVFGLEQVL